MTGIQLPGLATGLDTATLIAQLMKVEAQPQTLLKNNLANTNLRITDLQSLNAKIAALADSAAANVGGSSLNPLTVTSSSSAVTAVLGTGASSGSLEITVDRTASAQVDVTAAMASWPDAPPTLTLVGADGTATEITASHASLDAVVSAINSAGVGVTAMKVRAGQDSNGDDLFRLQLQSSATGAAHGFEAYRGTAADVDAGTAARLLDSPGAARIRTAQDAEVRMWAGTGAEQAITSDTNTFAELLPGMDVTVSAPSTTPVTLTAARDDAAATKVVSDFVTRFTDIISLIKTNAAASQTTDSSGNVNTVLGTFTGDSTVREANDALMRAATDPVDGLSLSTIGINLTKDGTITFDQDAFAAALKNEPEQTQHLFSTISDRIATAAKTISDPYTGTLTQEITGKQSQASNLTDQIADWDRRLATRQASLEQVYANLEVQINTMNSQRDYLQSQLDALLPPSTSSSKK